MLKTRVLTAVVFLALFLSALYIFSSIGWLVFCAAVLGVAAWEWGGLAGLPAAGRYVYAGLVVAPFALAGVFDSGLKGGLEMPFAVYCASAIFWSIFVPLWLWRRPRVGRPLMLIVGVVVLVPAFTALVDLRGLIGPGRLIAVLAIVWISDSAGYFVGSALGKHKLAPSISPGKTWEGVLAALLAVTIYAPVWVGIGGDASLPDRLRQAAGGGVWFAAMLVGLAVIGMIGDLFESLIKRQAGVKDSGTLLPGHGGMLDRIDAPVAMLPLAVLAFVK